MLSLSIEFEVILKLLLKFHYKIKNVDQKINDNLWKLCINRKKLINYEFDHEQNLKIF